MLVSITVICKYNSVMFSNSVYLRLQKIYEAKTVFISYKLASFSLC